MTEAAISMPPAAAPKVDPETLVIRAKPQRAIRFRRGLIIGIAAFGSVSLMTVAWIALKPQVFQHVASQEELSQPNTRQAGDALSGVPATYGDAPKLGPPLPGDLGRPILEHQRKMALETGPVGMDASARAAQAERERGAAELKAARESGVLVQGKGGAQTVAVTPPQAAALAAGPAPNRHAIPLASRHPERPALGLREVGREGGWRPQFGLARGNAEPGGADHGVGGVVVIAGEGGVGR